MVLAFLYCHNRFAVRCFCDEERGLFLYNFEEGLACPERDAVFGFPESAFFEVQGFGLARYKTGEEREAGGWEGG